MRKKKKKDKRFSGSCINCDNCVYIGEGDSICTLEDPVLVLEDWESTDEYYYCGGEGYEPTDEDEEEYSDEW